MKCICGNILLIEHEKTLGTCIECQFKEEARLEAKRMNIQEDKSICCP